MLQDIFPQTKFTEHSIAKSRCRASSNTSGSLGSPPNLLSYTAFTRNGAWLKPLTGSTHLAQDDRSIVAILFKLKSNLVWVRAVSDETGVTTLKLVDNELRAELVSGTTCQVVIDSNVCLPTAGGPVCSGQLRNSLSDLSYCTWNSLGNDLSTAKLVNAVKSLHSASIYPTTVLIDDGWQQVDDKRRLIHNYPAKDNFPHGLKGTVASLHKLGVSKVFVWTAICGYWLGFKNEDYEMVTVNFFGTDTKIPSVNAVGQYYDDFFKYLQGEQITGAKVDVCNFLDEIQSKEKQALQIAYRNAVKFAAAKYKLEVIWCMDQVPYILRVSDQGIAKGPGPGSMRNSDDYFPHNADSHAWHVYANFLNSLYTRSYPRHGRLDFDMFQSKLSDEGYKNEKAPSLHSVARACCGASITITDEAGIHNAGLINHLIAEGKVLTLPQEFEVVDPFQPFDAKKFVRINNFTDYGSIGVFNLSDTQLKQTIQIPVGYIGRGFRSGLVGCTFEDEWQDPVTALSIELESLGWELIHVGRSHFWKQTEVAVLGYIDKFVGAAAIQQVKYGERITIKVLAGEGVLGVYMDPIRKVDVLCGGQITDFDVKGNLMEINVPSGTAAIEISSSDDWIMLGN